MLAAMERPTVATLRTIADLHRLPWTDAELEAALPAVTGALAMLATLEAIAVDSVEPTTHFRVV
jgi:Asp-tRNA(Asn)/Glu-tRNA(Gln) amidotransferase C subunit